MLFLKSYGKTRRSNRSWHRCNLHTTYSFSRCPKVKRFMKLEGHSAVLLRHATYSSSLIEYRLPRLQWHPCGQGKSVTVNECHSNRIWPQRPWILCKCDPNSPRTLTSRKFQFEPGHNIGQRVHQNIHISLMGELIASFSVESDTKKVSL